LFKNILVPFYVSGGSPPETDKAIEIANTLQANLHILYVAGERRHLPIARTLSALSFYRKGPVAEKFRQPDFRGGQATSLHPALSFYFNVRHEEFRKAVVTYCWKNDIDLVLFFSNHAGYIEKLRQHFRVNAISGKLDCPVLFVHPWQGIFNIRNIVIPIGNFLPIRRLIFASYLGKIFHSRIHLVALRGGLFNPGSGNCQCIDKAYHILQRNTNLPVEYNTIEGRNMEEALFRYGKKIQADLILTNPDDDSVLSSLLKGIAKKHDTHLTGISTLTVRML